MGKLYFSVLALGVFLALSFGLIIPATISAKDDIGVWFAITYLLVIVPMVSWRLVKKVVFYVKNSELNNQLQGKM